jgi:hypothetical protein
VGWLAAALAVGVLAWGGPAGSDEAEQSLARYEQPVEDAIDRALAYLAKRQNKDGSWPAQYEGNTAIASLCVMAFLSKGYTPGTGPYGENIDRGIDFVLDHAKDNGLLIGKRTSHGPMYSHTISTLMLSEVSGMVPDRRRQERIDEVLPKALKLILAAQQVRKKSSHQGGWRYQHSSSDSDISCSGWALMALRSARNSGSAVPAEAIDEAVRFVMNCRHSSGGFCYMPGKEPGLARTGTALLCLELCGHHGEKPCTGAGDWILEHLPRKLGGKFFYYGLYYCSQGMFQLGGDYWPQWGRHMYDMMLDHQRKDGSWPSGSHNEAKAGPCYATAMGVLALSVSLRQLPIYQR